MPRKSQAEIKRTADSLMLTFKGAVAAKIDMKNGMVTVYPSTSATVKNAVHDFFIANKIAATPKIYNGELAVERDGQSFFCSPHTFKMNEREVKYHS